MFRSRKYYIILILLSALFVLAGNPLRPMFALFANLFGIQTEIPLPFPEVNVDHTGKARFSLGIQVPPGAGDLVPNISIQYSGSTNQGILGKGWSLSGFSQVAKNPSLGIHYGSSDGFVSDQFGEILSSNGDYKFKYETFSKVDLSSNVWKIRDRNGTVYSFGQNNSSGANSILDGNGQPVTYYLDQVRDRFGNGYDISYDPETLQSNEPIPKEVRYARGNARIVFSYTDRSDGFGEKLFYATRQISRRKLLDRIQVFAKDESGAEKEVETYEFDYDSLDGQSILSSFHREQYKPITFSYTQRSKQSDLLQSSGKSFKNSYRALEPSVQSSCSITQAICACTADWGCIVASNYTAPDLCRAGMEAFQDVCVNGVEMSFVTAMDTDGDGSPELVRILGEMGDQKFTVSSLGSWDGSGNISLSAAENRVGDPIGLSTQGQILPGDFNGDGKSDFLVLRQKGLPLKVHYGPNFSSSEYSNILIGTLDSTADDFSQRFFTADVNGDGKTDFLQTADGSSIEVFLSTGSGFQKSQSLAITDFGTEFQQFVDLDRNGVPDFVRIATTNGNKRLIVTFFDSQNGQLLPLESTEISRPSFGAHGDQFLADINGDGYADFAFFSLTGSQGNISYYPFDGRKFVSNGASPFVSSEVNGAYANLEKKKFSYLASSSYLEIDLSGDGIKDRVTYDTSNYLNPFFKVELYDPVQSTYLPAFNLYWNQDQSMDLNGDGTLDTIRANAVNTTDPANTDPSVESITTRNFSISITNLLYYEVPIDLSDYLPASPSSGSAAQNAYFNWRNPKTFLDLNGDGKADFLRFDDSSSLLSISYAKVGGDGNTIYSADGDDTWSTNGFFMALDINSDGKPELLGMDGNQKGFQSSIPSSAPFINTTLYRQFPYESNVSISLLRFRKEVPSGLVAQMENGSVSSSGTVMQTLDYQLAKDHIGACSIGAPSSDPKIQSVCFTDVLLTSLSQKAGDSVLSSQKFQYSNSRIFLGGFRNSSYIGFQSVGQTDLVSNSQVQSKYEPSFLEMVGSPTYQVSFRNGVQVGESFRSYTKSSSQFGSILILPGASTENSYSGGQLLGSTTITPVYDSFGNVIGKSTNTNGTTLTETNAYQNDWNAGILGLPTDRQIQRDGNLISYKKMEYSNSSISSVQEMVSTGVWKAQFIHSYDEYGNPISVQDSNGNISNIQYDPVVHKYPTQISNSLGHTTLKTYDYTRGLELSNTDPNGAVSKTEYDPLGRAAFSYLPGESDWSEKFEYENTGDLENQLVRKVFRISNGETWREDLSNYITGISKKRSSLGSGYVLVEETHKDPQGRVVRKVDPYLEGSDPFSWTDFSYDVEGNQTKATRNDGTITDISRDGLSITSTDSLGGNILGRTVEVKNALGQVISVTKQGKTIGYSYSPNGKTSQISDPENGTTYIETDLAGRQTKIIHPDSGITEFSYDPNSGNLIEQRNANGSKVGYGYDVLGRTVQVTGRSSQGELESHAYEYDDPQKSNAIGRLTRVTDNLGSTEFQYDIRGNQTLIQKNLIDEDLTFLIQKKFNLQNQVEEIVYPDGSIAKNLYSDAGYLSGITLTPSNGSGSDFPVVQYNGPILEDGQIKIQRVLGNGVRTDIYYDPIQLRPTKFKTSKDTQTYQSIEYSYDNFGNYLSIQDKVNPGRSQNFTYDPLNRLLTAAGVYGSEDYQYSDSGKLLQKGNLTYSYTNQSHKNAVSRVVGQNTSYDYSYDSSGNVISRSGENFTYNSFQKLKSLTTADQDTILFDYDFTGTRIRKTKSSDSSKTISIGGIYEVVLTPGQSPQHTLYFKGNAGDLVGQWTRTDAVLVSKALMVEDPSSQMRSAWNGLVWNLKDKSIRGIKYFFLIPGTNLGFLYIAIFLSLGFAFLAYQEGIRSILFKFATPILLLSFSHCSVFMPNGNGTPPWLIAPQFSSDTPSVSNPYEPGGAGSGAGLPFSGFLFLHPDHLGSITMATDGNGNRIAGGDQGGASYISYKPYGEIQRTDSSGPDVFRYKYNGQEEDKETGLYYFKARYYDPILGRFLQADTVMDSNRPMGMDLYMYTEGNPVRYTDPSGNSILSSFLDRNGLGFFNFHISVSGFFQRAFFISSQRWSDALGVGAAIAPVTLIGTALGIGAAGVGIASIVGLNLMGVALGGALAGSAGATMAAVTGLVASMGAVSVASTITMVAGALGIGAGLLASSVAMVAGATALLAGVAALTVASFLVMAALVTAIVPAAGIAYLLSTTALIAGYVGVAFAGSVLSPFTLQAYIAGGLSKSSFNNIHWSEKDARIAACYATGIQFGIMMGVSAAGIFGAITGEYTLIKKAAEYFGYASTANSAYKKDWRSVGADAVGYYIEYETKKAAPPIGLVLDYGDAVHKTCGGSL
ncbi:type IV secretion protein Rhs [Leptospira langatensis]|uniref:Type IV secretion protein Rhs n=1 Tax=Leptospira langatensis TaxID=2484983 RepID=A0A5F1ZW20_9LEPT|nr:RHS repeat-associated core domain-containing protein [Leptospira langatensis]TGK00144.1 type IV secretion protein Rhs [Leptospira langatensis]TGL42779.1 type IV secretion protein Rhs [Leptospira langatensis]